MVESLGTKHLQKKSPANVLDKLSPLHYDDVSTKAVTDKLHSTRLLGVDMSDQECVSTQMEMAKRMAAVYTAANYLVFPRYALVRTRRPCSEWHGSLGGTGRSLS